MTYFNRTIVADLGILGERELEVEGEIVPTEPSNRDSLGVPMTEPVRGGVHIERISLLHKGGWVGEGYMTPDGKPKPVDVTDLFDPRCMKTIAGLVHRDLLATMREGG